MERPLYAVCPRCGQKAQITKFIWDWDGEQDIALVKCRCGKSRLPYCESRVLKVDLNNPYMKEEHFDLLVPPGWNREMWEKFQGVLARW